jgi:predicted DCC family thiol-disulfide oxidoreductase YuxK
MKQPTPASAPQCWLFFDSECPMCAGVVRHFYPLFLELGVRTESLHSPGVCETLGISRNKLLAQGWMITQDGRRIGGADIWLYIAARIWWGFPFTLLAALPGGYRLIDFCYRWFARNRYRIEPAFPRRIHLRHHDPLF